MRRFVLSSTLFIGVFCGCSAPAQSALRDFITLRGDQLMEGPRPLRFISWNVPNLQMIEDNLPFTEINPWRLPDAFEIRDALETVRSMGGTVARTYVLSVRRTNDTPDMPRHVLGPGKFNEDAFRQFDLVLKIANEQGIRLILPLVDNWVWQGGRAEYAGFRGKSRDAFWTDPEIIDDFKKTIRFVLLRTNTLTGIRYCDDKAVLCWETGNELSSPPAWTREIAAYLKTLDANHLVMDGLNAALLRNESLTNPFVDIVTTHHYPNPRLKKSFAQFIRENAALAKGKKAYVIGEFGFVSTADMNDALQAIDDTGIAGGLVWSLRFRNRDGGFYWHSEPAGGNLYKAYHWPGSVIGETYDEIRLMELVRQKAFALRGLTLPRIPVPAPPQLLPITDTAAISWQGSLGATSYIVERAPKATGPWTVAGDKIDESFVQYRPLFVDESAPAGNWYYRVRASNDSGASEPSIVIGPAPVTHGTRVDEFSDFSKVHAQYGRWATQTRDCRKAKEDAHRAGGSAGSALVYQLPAAITGFRVYVFFPGAGADPRFSVSADGQQYRDIQAGNGMYFTGPGEYRYWKPVLYQIKNVGVDARYLKIELTGETQIGRLEITYELDHDENE